MATISKETKNFGMPWEKEYGYSQAVKVGDTIYISGQVSHDDKGKVIGHGDMETQMRTAYSNIENILSQYGSAMENLVEETLTDMDSAFAAAVKAERKSLMEPPKLQARLFRFSALHYLSL